MNREFWERLEQQTGCTVLYDEPLCRHTSFQIGGPAEALITAPDVVALQSAFRMLKSESVPVRFLGNGSNLLISDEGVSGAVLRLSGDTPIQIQGTTVTCGAGVPLKHVCRAVRDHALSGLEFAFGIPGFVGGAVFMNAGAYGGEMKDVVRSATVLLPNGEIVKWSAEQLDLSYRHSALMQNGGIVLSVDMELKHGDASEIDAAMNDYMKRRRDKQPLEYPSAGSYFKRPTGYFAGALIEQSGLKGTTVGGAQVSEKHAGFVINRGGATCDDVLRLEELVRQKVFADHGVTLEREVQYWGKDV